MNIIYVILGVLLGLHLGFRTVYIVMASTSGYYSNKTRLLMSLWGFVTIFALTTWLSINALIAMLGVWKRFIWLII